MATTTRTSRRIGIEPREVDLTPIRSSVLTKADRVEMNAFFLEQRAKNDRDPTIVHLRQQLEAKKGKKLILDVSAKMVEVASRQAVQAHGKHEDQILIVASVKQQARGIPIRATAKRAAPLAKGTQAKAAAKKVKK
ncbi:MAG: hypothetical protein ACRYG7_46930 [Janthinobacterium lividum]